MIIWPPPPVDVEANWQLTKYQLTTVYSMKIIIASWWTSCETKKKLDNEPDSNLGGFPTPHIAVKVFLCYRLPGHHSVNGPATSRKNNHTGNQTYLLHITLVDGFCCFEESLSCLRLIPACPQDAQLVLTTQTTNTWANDQNHLISVQWDDMNKLESLALFLRL